MNDPNIKNWFDDIESVIVEPLKFKFKLAIGEDAYASLRMKNKLYEVWDAFGVGATAATVVKSSAVASTFFAPTGWLAAIGIGTATTQIGWVIAAVVVSTGAYVGISKYIKDTTKGRVTVIPEFINTPLDILGLALFDLIVPLALKLANIDGVIDQSEKKVITRYFVKEWGYDPVFVEKGIEYTETKLSDFSIKALAYNLAEFKKQNPDCNYKIMSKDILEFLTEITEADGRVDEREEMAINLVKNIFSDVGALNLKKSVKKGTEKVKATVTNVVTKGVFGLKE